MKKTLFTSIFMASILATSCSPQSPKVVDNSQIDSVMISRVDSVAIGKSYLDSAMRCVSMGIKGEVTAKEANRLSEPYMDKFNEIIGNVSVQDSISLRKYHIAKANDIVDLQIKYHSQ